MDYSYQKAKVNQSGESLIVNIVKEVAVDDSQAKDKLLLEIKTKIQPKQIKLLVDGNSADFKDILIK